MNRVLSIIRNDVRYLIRKLAIGLNRLSGGKIHPDSVTIFGFIMHLPIAILIASEHFVGGAIMLVIFGLFDTLDGELARTQNRASNRGMLLDASTDKMKETLLYTGAAYVLASSVNPITATWAAAACGASLCVSYVKAKGEAAVASSGKKIPHAELNHMFGDGLMTFEVRMAVLVLGLLTNRLVLALAVITILASYTAVQRLVTIIKKI